GRISGAFLARGAEVNRKQRRRTIQQLEPARIALRRQMMPLRIVVRRAELGVMVEVPARELARRDAARHGVQPAERPLEVWTTSLKHRVMYDLVQQDRDV